MSLRSLVAAEAAIRYYWFKRNRTLLFLSVVWPYLTVLVLYTLGNAYGSLDRYRESMGIDYPLLYMFAASTVAHSAVSVVDESASIAQWHRWLGTLTYIMASPHRTWVFVVITGLVTSLFMTTITVSALLPAVILVSGLEGSLRLAVVYLVIIAGMAPLIAIAGVAAMMSLLAREEGNVMAFLNPLLLLLSGVFYPIEILPRLLEASSRLLPVSYLVEAAKLAAAFDGPLTGGMFLVAYVIALMTLVYNSAGLLALEWADRGIRRKGVG